MNSRPVTVREWQAGNARSVDTVESQDVDITRNITLYVYGKQNAVHLKADGSAPNVIKKKTDMTGPAIPMMETHIVICVQENCIRL